MITMKFPCPHCGQRLEAEPAMSGQAVACPVCAAAVRVPPATGSSRGRDVFVYFAVSFAILFVIGWALFYRSDKFSAALHHSSRLFGRNSPRQANYATEIQPLLTNYCYSCHGNGKHKGDLALDKYHHEGDILKDRKTWEKVLQNLKAGVMPPEDKKQPTLSEREMMVNWIDAKLFFVDCDNPDPGRVTIRRLNRAEYNNTIRDLVGVDFQPADDFPADDSGYGFDNIGDVLSVPPVLLEKYLGAAEKVLSAAIVTPEETKNQKRVFPSNAAQVGYNAKRLGNGWVGLNSIEEDDVSVAFKAPVEGEYILRARSYARNDGDATMKLTFLAEKDVLETREVMATRDAPKYYEARFFSPAGPRHLSVAVRKLAGSGGRRVGQKGTIYVEQLEIEGPFNARSEKLPETHRRIFVRQPAPAREPAAREIITSFARRAFRRPVTPVEADRLLKLFRMADAEGESFEKSVKIALEAVLISPHFLFRGEVQAEPNNPKSIHPVDDYALASRLSYFLWSSMPDDQLFSLAERKMLHKDLEGQVRRMLKDPKAASLTENFAGQWLQLRNLRQMAPDPELFPEFDSSLRGDMEVETLMFFGNIMHEDRSVLEFIDADYTFLNERLARFYGLNGVSGDQFRRVSLKGSGRGGVLTQGSILTLTSNPTRTSPVKRGKWVLENLLGTPPPPPPPNVPELKEGKELTGSLRQRMEQHRGNPVCASCHARMDPIGFGLENFDGIGAYRSTEGKLPIDSSGKLVSGETFRGAGELRKILLGKRRDEFVRCLSEKMLTFALGRGTEFYDRCAIDKISLAVAKNEYRFSSLILEVVKSVPFQQRRGEGEPAEQSALDTPQAAKGN